MAVLFRQIYIGISQGSHHFRGSLWMPMVVFLKIYMREIGRVLLAAADSVHDLPSIAALHLDLIAVNCEHNPWLSIL